MGNAAMTQEVTGRLDDVVGAAMIGNADTGMTGTTSQHDHPCDAPLPPCSRQSSPCPL